MNSPSIQFLHNFLDYSNIISVCDIACGAGHLGLSFIDVADRIVGVDPAPNMLSSFKSLAYSRGHTIETFEAYAENLPLHNNEFDLVTSRLAPHHSQNIQRAVSEMARLQNQVVIQR